MSESSDANDVAPNEPAEHVFLITNKQLVTWVQLIAAFSMILGSMYSTWIRIDLELQEIRNEGRDDTSISVEDSLDERTWRITTYYQFDNDSNLDYDVSVIVQTNNELIAEYEGTVETKDRTWTMLLATAIISALAAALIISKQFVEFESEKTVFLPLLIAGFLAIATCTQFAMTYDPFQESEATPDNIPDDEGECLTQSSRGIPVIYEQYEGSECDYGGEQVNLKGEAGVRTGFYLSAIAGLMMIFIYLRLLKQAGIRFITIIDDEPSDIQVLHSSELKVIEPSNVDQLSSTETTENQSDFEFEASGIAVRGSESKADIAERKRIQKKNWGAIFLIGSLVCILYLLYPGVMEYIGALDDDYRVTDLDAETTQGTNDWLYQITLLDGGEDGYYSQSSLSISLVSEEGTTHLCGTLSNHRCNIHLVDPSDSISDGWHEGESWNLRENGVNICTGGHEGRWKVVIEVNRMGDLQILEGPDYINCN